MGQKQSRVPTRDSCVSPNQPLVVYTVKGNRVVIPPNCYFNLNTGRINKNLPVSGVDIHTAKNLRSFGDTESCKAHVHVNESVGSAFGTFGPKGSKPQVTEHFDFCGIVADMWLVKVIDGDTIDVMVKFKFEELLRVCFLSTRMNGEIPIHPSGDFVTQLRLRLFAINAAELNQPGGQDAKTHLENLIKRQNNIRVLLGTKDKYGRQLAWIFGDVDENVNLTMLANYPDCVKLY